MSAVLVIGAAGFIGRQLVRTLLDAGCSVIGVDNFITSERDDVRPLLTASRFRFIEADVTTSAFPAAIAGERIDAIYHLACPTGVPNLAPLGLEMLLTCYEGTLAALNLAREHGAPLLLASSAEVYGNPERTPQDESYCGNVDPLGPRKGYEEGKRVAETLCAVYAERFGVRAVIARIFNTYGPGMSLAETRIVPAFVRAAIEGRPLLVHGEGVQTRCHLYVGDLVAGLRLALAHGAPGRAYNLGGTAPISVRALADRIVRLAASHSAIVAVERPAHDHDHRLPDTTRARAELGWQPRIELDAGLLATIADTRARLALHPRAQGSAR